MDSEGSPPNNLTLTDLSDQDVLAALRGGQIAALDVLYGRYAKLVYSLAHRILGNSEEAEDMTQEVFIHLWQKDTYQSHRGALKTFLLTLTRSRSIDKIRTRGSQNRFLQRWQRLSDPTQESLPLDHASTDERSGYLRQALTTLADSERQILEIAYYGGMSQSQIAKHLNLPLGTVKSRSRQALKKLRQQLQNLQEQR